jgi:hypothetical protein
LVADVNPQCRLSYLRKDKEVAEADWDLFAKDLGRAFFEHVVATEIAKTLIGHPTPAAFGQYAMVAAKPGTIGQRRATGDQWRVPGAQQLHPWREVHGRAGVTMGVRCHAHRGGARGSEDSDGLR